jgi:Fur family peroxide stress response transcriptional regulator
MTPQRMSILKVILSSKDHPTVEQIHEVVQQDFPMTSLATVYNTVALLKEIGVVNEIPISGGAGSRFDGFHEQQHSHLLCERCGSISDLDIEQLQGLDNTVEEISGYSDVSFDLVFRGVCPACRELHAKV